MTAKKYTNLKGTLLIVTYGRSGSTLLQSLLHIIPGCHLAGENYNVLEGLFRASQRARRSSNKWGEKPHPQWHPWHGADRLVPRRFERKLVDLFVEEILCPPDDVRWYGFKEIRYLTLEDDLPALLNFCRRAFHNTFFVFLSRDGDSVANSKWWKKQPRQSVLKMITEMDQRFATFTAKHPTCSHHVKYEDFTRDPASLQILFDKLGEPLDIVAAKQILGRRLTH